MARPNVSNFGSLYDGAVTLFPKKLALVQYSTGEEVTYAELHERIARAGNALRELGVGRGDRVAIAFPNELHIIYTIFGAMRLGAVPVPINVQVPQETVDYVVDDCEASVIVSSGTSDVLRKAVASASAIERVETLAIVDDDPEVDTDEMMVISFTASMDDAEAELPSVEVDPDDPAFQPYTSGSTGKPKGVVLTHAGTKWNVSTFRKIGMFDEEDTSIAAGPLYHKNAMLGTVKPFLEVGGSIVILDEFDTGKFIAAIEEYDVTYFPGVPAMFKMLVNDTESLEEHDVSSVEWAICGSASVPEKLMTDFEDTFGADVGESYGITEGGPIVSQTPRWGIQKQGTAGPAIPECETLIVDPETGETVSPGDLGELLVSNPGLGRYYGRPEKNAEAFEIRDGRTYLHTDDVALKDSDGYHEILGRLDDMMIVGGENVYPTEVEDTLIKHPKVDDVAVVAAPHATKGEAPVAFVVAEGLTEDDLKTFAIENGPVYAHPRRVFFRETLPRSGTEKLDHDAMKEEAVDLVDGAID